MEIPEKLKPVINYYNNNQLDEAEKLLENIKKEIKNKFLILKIYSSIYQKKQNWEKFIEINNKLLDYEDDKEKTLVNIGIGYYKLGEINNSIKYYQSSVEQNASNEIGYENLSISYLEIGKFEKSIENSLKVLELNRKNLKSQTILIDTLNYKIPEKQKNNYILLINKKILELNELINEEVPDLKTIKLLLNKSYEILNNSKYEIKYNKTQIYRRDRQNLNCERHFKVFNKFEVIPEYCFNCYKVQIIPKNIIELIKLYFLFNKRIFKDNNFRKCMVETRPDIKGNYKGYIYCKDLKEAEEIIKLIKNKISKNNIDTKSIEIKHGCSEYYKKYPEFKDINYFGKQKIEYNRDWKKFEEIIDNQKIKREEKDEKFFGTTLNKLNISDLLVINNWLAYSKSIEDASLKEIFDREIYT